MARPFEMDAIDERYFVFFSSDFDCIEPLVESNYSRLLDINNIERVNGTKNEAHNRIEMMSIRMNECSCMLANIEHAHMLN